MSCKCPKEKAHTGLKLLLCLQIGSVSYERQPIADHASNLANTIQGNLKRSLEALGVVCLGPKLILNTPHSHARL
jgi:type IV secretory pathway VirB2 component (pilin)